MHVPACAQVQGGGEDYTLGNVDDLDPSEWQVPPHCIPIHANVTTYDWSALIAATQFDVIMMDPPWQLATANPTRGGCTFCCRRPYACSAVQGVQVHLLNHHDEQDSKAHACHVRSWSHVEARALRWLCQPHQRISGQPYLSEPQNCFNAIQIKLLPHAQEWRWATAS